MDVFILPLIIEGIPAHVTSSNHLFIVYFLLSIVWEKQLTDITAINFVHSHLDVNSVLPVMKRPGISVRVTKYPPPPME